MEELGVVALITLVLVDLVVAETVEVIQVKVMQQEMLVLQIQAEAVELVHKLVVAMVALE